MNNEFVIANVLPGKLNALVKNIMKQTSTNDPNEAVRCVNAGEWVLAQKILVGLSAPSEPIIVGPLSKTFSAKSFFCNSNADVKLYVWDDFKDRIIERVGNVSKKPTTEIVSRDLTKAMNDSEIRAELPENHTFQLDDLWIIAGLLHHQPKGENGVLLNNGYANLFYMQVGALVLVVGVGWDGSGWSVGTWDLGEYGRWGGGSRVFSRNG